MVLIGQDGLEEFIELAMNLAHSLRPRVYGIHDGTRLQDIINEQDAPHLKQTHAVRIELQVLGLGAIHKNQIIVISRQGRQNIGRIPF